MRHLRQNEDRQLTEEEESEEEYEQGRYQQGGLFGCASTCKLTKEKGQHGCPTCSKLQMLVTSYLLAAILAAIKRKGVCN